MMKTIIQTDRAPKAIGPYSQAVKHNGIIYCSGQISVEPRTMNLTGEPVEVQTLQVMKNLEEVLTAAGSSFSNVLKCTLFLADMNDFDKVNDVYSRYFNERPPARETVAVKALPKNALIEISCIASENY
ncbi:MAG: RidA family protein [Balneolaceae bacterium]